MCLGGFLSPLFVAGPSFIEKLTDGQKADINKKFEIYHNTGRLKGSAAKAARVQFAKSSDAQSEGEGSEPSRSDASEDSEDGESHNLFKALAVLKDAQCAGPYRHACWALIT